MRMQIRKTLDPRKLSTQGPLTWSHHRGPRGSITSSAMTSFIMTLSPRLDSDLVYLSHPPLGPLALYAALATSNAVAGWSPVGSSSTDSPWVLQLPTGEIPRENTGGHAPRAAGHAQVAMALNASSATNLVGKAEAKTCVGRCVQETMSLNTALQVE